jgi:site-specific DNA recombinase
MIAAIYARKSTDQNVVDEAKSVTRQVEHARAYAARKGWTVDDEHVYVDDGISGAEFVKRPGFLRLMNALKPRAPFRVLIMSEESRLGRESIETGWTLKKITDAGVRVFYYLEDRERTLDGALDKMMMQLTSFASEMERERGRQRTRDAMVRKARRGHVAGGKVYGYRNVEVLAAGVRDHVRREILPEEAAIIRRIYERAAGGHGYSRIAKALNADGVASPARGRGWATGGVREILFRDLYRGRVVYGKTRWTDRGGTRVKVDVPEAEWLTLEAPELRIVTEGEWQAVHARLEQTRAVYRKSGRGALWGRPEAHAGGHGTGYLLSGLLLCGACGWGLHATHRTSQRGTPQRYYICTAHRTRGTTVCSNRWSAPMAALHASVIEHVRRDVLSDDLVRDVARRALELRAARTISAGDERQALLRELERVQTELRRYAEAVGAGDALPALLDAMRARERRRQELEAKLSALTGNGRQTPVAAAQVYRDIAARLTDWHGLLDRHPERSREILRSVLVGRLVVTPTTRADGTWLEYRGEASYSKVLAGLIGVNGLVPPG